MRRQYFVSSILHICRHPLAACLPPPKIRLVLLHLIFLCLCPAQILASGDHLESEMLFITEQFDFFSSALDSILGIGSDASYSADPRSLIPELSSLDNNVLAAVSDIATDSSSDILFSDSAAAGGNFTDKVGTKGRRSITAPPQPPDFGSLCAAPWCVARITPQGTRQCLSVPCSDRQRCRANTWSAARGRPALKWTQCSAAQSCIAFKSWHDAQKDHRQYLLICRRVCT